MIKILSIFGTRPEAIKMAPVVQELARRPTIKSIVCVTAQHREMLDQVMDIFKLKSDYDLNIMTAGQTLSRITSRALLGLEPIIEKETPDIVLVQGDTTTAFVGALAAFYHQVAVGHIEAGLRTDNKYSPYPEEINRQTIGVLADLHFVPTSVSRENLLREGKPAENIILTGNTAIDALKMTVHDTYENELTKWVGDDRLILMTSHRRENLGEPMKNVFRAVLTLTEKFPNVKVIYPVHMNKLVQTAADEILSGSSKVRLVAPLDVLEFHNLMNKSYLIMSDSGGIQEEAPSLGKPVLVTRDTTERPEGITAGTLKLVGTDYATIVKAASLLLSDQTAYQKMSQATNPYGDGHASERIVDALIERFGSAQKNL